MILKLTVRMCVQNGDLHLRNEEGGRPPNKYEDSELEVIFCENDTLRLTEKGRYIANRCAIYDDSTLWAKLTNRERGYPNN